ncbi:MAG: UvrD-helicase domain-containing protein, partial [Pseudomonadales bacterium]|nr:UvrD-helicase domain-containing protein [Pseudomonadales bacterium]
LVDEYQDTNASQYQLVKLLCGEKANLTAVGDDDQSIYAWRGAKPENLMQLQKDFPWLKIIKLEQNYRSSGRILKAANELISHNPHNFEKKLWSEHDFGPPIRVLQCKNEEDEVERIAIEILMQRAQRNNHFRDYAVLYRGNHQAKLLEIKLQQNHIPYSMSGGTSFFSRTEIKDIMAYLRLLVNPDDDNAFLRIINTPRRGIGPTTLQKLGEYSKQRQASLFNVVDDIGFSSQLSEEHLSRLRQFTRWMNEVRENCYKQNPVPILREMIDDIGYLAWLHQNSKSPVAAEKRMQNINFLIDAIEDSLKKQNEMDDGEDNIEAAIAKLLLQDILERQEEEDLTDRVALMTLHAAKGLEFPHVYLMGMEEELLPHRNSIENDDIGEERRLAYVGITRAKKTLTLTLAEKRKTYGDSKICKASRFLDELPEEDLLWEGGARSTPLTEEQKKAQRKEGIAGLRNLINK